MKSAPTDGSVLMYGTSATTVAQVVTRKTPTFDLEKDLTAIALTGTVCVVYVVSATLGVNNMAEYIVWLKKNPKNPTFGTTDFGSATHFFRVELGQTIGLPMLPVAYKGAAPLVGDLIAGHVPAGCGGLTDFLVHHQSGKLKIIGITGGGRSGLSQAHLRGLLRFLRSGQAEPSPLSICGTGSCARRPNHPTLKTNSLAWVLKCRPRRRPRCILGR